MKLVSLLKLRAVMQCVTKGHYIVVHLEFQYMGRHLLTIKQRNQIIHRTIVEFASMSSLLAKLQPFT